MSRGDRFISWLLDHLPQRVAEAPERILINAAVAAIGLSGLLGLALGGGPRPNSLLTLWPLWLSYEWVAAMLVGGVCALAGFLRGLRTVERLGYLLVGVACTLYGVAEIITRGPRGIFPAVIFLGIACSKAIRLAVTSAARASVLREDDEAHR